MITEEMARKEAARCGIEILKIMEIYKDDVQFIVDLHQMLYRYLEHTNKLESTREAGANLPHNLAYLNKEEEE